MNKELFHIHTELKNQFASAIGKIVGDKIEFSPYVRFSFPRDSDELFEDIVGIEYDPEEKTHFVHNYITSIDLNVQEYWTPLQDLSFEELFEIAERI